ncbi:MAG TPA: PRC and DUF2382 domain-containing protein [Gammaproteobacteria bacterium]|nr:PRC and DUF2382 domain-containing protein [Gammaproteobacteria bacterium]
MDTSNTSMPRAAGRLYDYAVCSSSGDRIGLVDAVWVDDATDRPEFISVKTGWIFGQDHIVPIETARIADADQTIRIPYSSDQVKSGPSFSIDADLSPSDEQQIYTYYGLKRSTARSPTGYGAGTAGQAGSVAGRAAAGKAGAMPSESDEVAVPKVEEELNVGKRAVQAGEVRLHKVVRTEHKEVPVDLRREEVHVERAPASGTTRVPGDAFEEKDITIPVMEEEPVVSKEARVTEEVRVKKDAGTERRTVGGEVRKTDVEIDEEGNVDTEGKPKKPIR